MRGIAERPHLLDAGSHYEGGGGASGAYRCNGGLA